MYKCSLRTTLLTPSPPARNCRSLLSSPHKSQDPIRIPASIIITIADFDAISGSSPLRICPTLDDKAHYVVGARPPSTAGEETLG